MKTKSDVEQLKADWIDNPTWCLWLAEGFDAYGTELYIFQKQQEINGHANVTADVVPVYDGLIGRMKTTALSN